MASSTRPDARLFAGREDDDAMVWGTMIWTGPLSFIDRVTSWHGDTALTASGASTATAKVHD
jgi:hypothetical protein